MNALKHTLIGNDKTLKQLQVDTSPGYQAAKQSQASELTNGSRSVDELTTSSDFYRVVTEHADPDSVENVFPNKGENKTLINSLCIDNHVH